MEIQPTYITNEQVKLLNEKGFNSTVLIPQQWQVVEWLRVKHGIWVQVEISNKLFAYRICSEDNNPNYSSIETKYYSLGFNTPQEAYSAAFDYVLKQLI